MKRPTNTMGRGVRERLARGAALLFSTVLMVVFSATAALAVTVHLKGGGVIQADEVSESADGFWLRRGGVTEFVGRARVERVERVAPTSVAGEVARVGSAGDASPPQPAADEVLWVYLVGGARMQVDEAAEAADGVWYRRGNISALIKKERVERVERGVAGVAKFAAASGGRRTYQWTTGRPSLDGLIRETASRHSLDPYLIFCVMEQESQFKPRAVSPVGARGLMQLMPGTARRFGVRKIFDPAQNLDGGARYLKELVRMFGGRLDLVLASYNAGEGAVMKYGQRVPPYAETRNYVRRISARYGVGAAPPAAAKP